MTRQSPDGLEYGTGRYALYPFLSLLPSGHPRWDLCCFAPGDTTANYRGYRAQWAVRNGRLFLTGFGGSASDRDVFGRRFDPAQPPRQIGMIDVHEVDTPVPARWISEDLVCPAGEAAGTSWIDFIPERFLLFRVLRGRVVAEASVPNTRRIQDVAFRSDKAALDAHLSGGAAPLAPGLATAVKGLDRALRAPDGEAARRRLAAMLWRAGEADLGVLIPALASTKDPDVLRWLGYALAGIGPGAAEAIPALTRVLTATDDPEVAKAMAYALGGIGPAAAPFLATMIPVVEACCQRAAGEQIRHCVDTLAQAGPPVIDALIDALLASRDTGVQVRIAHHLGEMGAAAVMPLRAAFAAADEDPQRVALARALGRVGSPAVLALNRLLDALRRARDDEARFVLADAVARIGLVSPDSLPALRAAFRAAEHRREFGRIAEAAAGLGRESVGFLLEEFEAADAVGRAEIARVLGELGARAIGARAAAVVGRLADAARDSADRDLIREVAEALAKIGAPADILFTARIRVLRCESSRYGMGDVLATMQAALESGLRLPDRDVRDLVALLVETGESPTGRSVAAMLGSVGERAADPLLAALDRVQEPDTRLVLLHALGQIGEPAGSAIDDAVAALSAARDDRVRLQIVDSLMRLGRPDERHMTTLGEVLVRSSFLPVWWRLGVVLAGYGAPAVTILVDILERATEDGQCRSIENALLEVAQSDASSGAPLLRALRMATRQRTMQALQAALNRSIQSRGTV